MLKGHKNNGATYLRISTFSRYGDAQYMHFGDFLKYSKNALIGQKPEVEVITSEQKATFQNPTILMTTQSDHGLTNWLSQSRDLNDVAYLGFVGESHKEILDLTLSPYLRKILQEDIKGGDNIHIFDIEFIYQLIGKFSDYRFIIWEFYSHFFKTWNCFYKNFTTLVFELCSPWVPIV